jgi:predicted nucleic acid-binding protein
VAQVNSAAAAAYFQTMPEALNLSSLLLFEFRQSVRFQIWLHAKVKTKGYSPSVAEAALSKLQANLKAGALVVAAVDWPDVHRLAETLSKRHTTTAGHRSLDLLHVATALYLGAKEFLTFDANQHTLAAAEKLTVRP